MAWSPGPIFGAFILAFYIKAFTITGTLRFPSNVSFAIFSAFGSFHGFVKPGQCRVDNLLPISHQIEGR
jgi:hypothetical protein